MSAYAAAARVAGESARASLRLVRRRSRDLLRRGEATRTVPLAIAAAIVAAAIVAAVLLEQVVLAQSAFKVDRLSQRLAEAEALHEELLLDAARLESPGRVEQYAREMLGMTDPTSVEYVVADVKTGGRDTTAVSSDETQLPATGAAASETLATGSSP